MDNPQPSSCHDEGIDLHQLLRTLWQRKNLILGSCVLGTAFGVSASLLSTRYIAEGLFMTPGVSAANYKRFEAVFSNGPRLQQYLQNTKLAATPDGALLFALAEDQTALSSTLRPEFAFTDKDQKAFGVKTTELDEPGAMIGVRIHFKHKKPTNGMPVALLAEYVRDTVIRVNLENMMLARCADFQTREQQLRNAQLTNDFNIAQEERRAAILRDIIARTPEAALSDNRQIVSLEKGSERFLSPAAQLVATEIQIADMKLADIRRERERIASALKRGYYCQAQQTLQQPNTGRAFLSEIGNIQTAVFQSHDRSIDIVEQTWNELDVERTNWANTYLQAMRFAASPEGTELKERKPRLALGLVFGGLLGGMLGMLGALVSARWRVDNEAKA